MGLNVFWIKIFNLMLRVEIINADARGKGLWVNLESTLVTRHLKKWIGYIR